MASGNIVFISTTQFMRLLIMITLLIALTACADVPVPSWMTGEPEDSVVTNARIIGEPSGRIDKTWPNLADVPVKPADLITLDAAHEDMKTLANDRAEGMVLQQPTQE